MEKGNTYEEGKLTLFTLKILKLFCFLLDIKMIMLRKFQEAAKMLESDSPPECKSLQTFL